MDINATAATTETTVTSPTTVTSDTIATSAVVGDVIVVADLAMVSDIATSTTSALPNGFTRVDKVAKRYDTSTKSIWRWAKEGAYSFPKPYKLTAGVTAWANIELLEWEKKRTRGKKDV